MALPEGVRPRYGIFTTDREFADYTIDGYVRSHNCKCEKRVKSVYDSYAIMEDGTKYQWIRPNDSARGHKCSVGVVDLGTCSLDFIREWIPCICLFAEQEKRYVLKDSNNTTDNNEPYDLHTLIVRYGSYDDIDVEFLDEHHYVKEHQTYSNFKRGQIKNPYDRNKYGMGYIGGGRHRAKVNGQYNYIYDVWADMINRCYHSKDRFSAYYGTCTVCEEWLNFQVFADWYVAHEYPVNERLHLDKDILFAGNKEYAPTKCMLVPQRLNLMFMNKPNKRGLSNGIIECKGGYLAKYGGQKIGVFSTVEEAYAEQTKKKKEAIDNLVYEYKGIIPEDVYNVIVAYKFDIRNDKNYKVA